MSIFTPKQFRLQPYTILDKSHFSSLCNNVAVTSICLAPYQKNMMIPRESNIFSMSFSPVNLAKTEPFHGIRTITDYLTEYSGR